MAQFTKKISIPSDTFVNLLTEMRALGYTGTAAISSLQIVNDNAETIYIHLSNSSTNEPDFLDDGIPVGQNAPDVSWSYAQSGEEVLDAATTWLSVENNTTVVIVAAIGGGI